MKKLLLLLSVAVLSACGTSPKSPEFLNEYLSRQYAYSKDKCYQATLKAIGEMKWGISKQDPSALTIVTDRAEVFRGAIASHSQYSSSLQMNSQTHKMHFKITGNNTSCEVKTTRYQIWQNNVELEKINTSWGKENIWDPFFNTIEEALKEG